jgi:hypothetical protein
MHILKMGTSNTKSLTCPSLVRPIVHLGEACWDPYREGQINALDRVQNKVAKFADHWNDSNWETLAQRKKAVRICAIFKAYTEEWAWKAICDRLQRPCYRGRVDYDRKLKSRNQRTSIGKY